MLFCDRKMNKKNINKAIRFTVRLDKNEHDLFKQSAKKKGFNCLSSYVRACLRTGEDKSFFSKSDEKKLLDIYKDIRKIGVNLNQIAKATNDASVRSKYQKEIAEQNSIAIEQINEQLKELKDIIKEYKKYD